jgi:hypothetical protein
VLEKAGVALDADSDATDVRPKEGESGEAGAAEPERLPSAFRDFINSLDLDDLGRGGEKGKR